MHTTSAILIIDDDAAIVDLITEFLTDEGYVAYAVPTAADTLASIARHPPALILFGLRMPSLSGAELIAQLHDGGLVTIPIVLITAAPYDVAPLLVPGSIECLAKPFELDDLVACVARYVRPAQAADQPPARYETRPT